MPNLDNNYPLKLKQKAYHLYVQKYVHTPIMSLLLTTCIRSTLSVVKQQQQQE